MASSYPGALDAFTNPTSTDAMDASAALYHDTQHANANDAIEAVQAELGTDPAGYETTVVARLDGLNRLLRPRATGTYFFNSSHGQTTYASAYGLNYVHYLPVYVPISMSVDALQIHVSTAEASATPRLGLYSNTANDMPGDLIVDAGTVDASTTGLKEATFTAEALAPGLYWMACCPQGVSTDLRMYQSANGIRIPAVNAATALASGYRESGVSGALPSSAASDPGVWLYTPQMAMRRASA